MGVGWRRRTCSGRWWAWRAWDHHSSSKRSVRPSKTKHRNVKNKDATRIQYTVWSLLPLQIDPTLIPSSVSPKHRYSSTRVKRRPVFDCARQWLFWPCCTGFSIRGGQSRGLLLIAPLVKKSRRRNRETSPFHFCLFFVSGFTKCSVRRYAWGIYSFSPGTFRKCSKVVNRY